MSTENVTVLFTDIVGSTELSSSLSAEAADEIGSRTFLDLAAGGRRGGDTEVKNLACYALILLTRDSRAL